MNPPLFSLPTNLAATVAQPPPQKEVLFQFLHDMGLSGIAFTATFQAYCRDPNRLSKVLKALECIRPEDVAMWASEFDTRLSHVPHQDPNIVRGDNSNPSEQSQMVFETPGLTSTKQPTAKRLTRGKDHLQWCNKRNRCRPEWKGTSTCFETHLKKKHWEKYDNKDGTFTCCDNTFEGRNAEEDLLHHIWNEDMEEVVSTPTPKKGRTPFNNIKPPITEETVVPQPMYNGSQIIYDPRMDFRHNSGNTSDLAASSSGYPVLEQAPPAAAHQYPDTITGGPSFDQHFSEDLPQDLHSTQIPASYPQNAVDYYSWPPGSLLT